MAGNKDFGKHLKKLREAKGYSQEQLAELVGLEYQTISRIETGLYFTSFDNLKKISSALNLTIKDLFDFPEDELTRKEILNNISKTVKSYDTEDLKNVYKMLNLYNEMRK